MTLKSSPYVKAAVLAAVLLAAVGCSDDSTKGVKLECETGLVVCGDRCCDGTCENGVCQPNATDEGNSLCPAGFQECQGACVDHRTAHNHCGTCGNACENNETCVGGTCQADACPTGFEVCNGACINKAIDAENCGTCGNTCGGNAYCADGACQCPKGYSDCDNDMQNGCETASLNCDRACEEGDQVTCGSGVCCDNVDACCGSACCGDGTTCCGDGICADLQKSAEHCGSCNNACTDGKSCVEGTCKRVCAEGTPDLCDTLDLCVNFANDALHCGDCNTRCDTTATCVEGVCTPSEVSCEADPDDPDALPKTHCWGACVDLASDPANCGACGHACGDKQTCEGGACICPEGSQVCGDTCVDYANDKDNCGTCGHVCGDGQVCEGGACVEPHVLMCFGKETDILSDVNNCGACLNKCSTGETCTEGKCTLVCGDGYTLCNGACVNLQASAANCGSCGKTCADGQACFASEAGAYCDCAAGRYDCDGLSANGCESTKPCTCTPGATQPCWRGATENRKEGICKDGTQICDASGHFWRACTGGIYPSAITCNDKGLYLGGDQNCNGVVDTNEACVTKCDLMLTDSSYIGCEYWAAYNHNYAADGYYAVILSNMGDEDANVTVYYGSDDNPVQNVTIPKKNVKTVRLAYKNDNGSMLASGSPNASHYSEIKTLVQRKGYRIVSTQPITAYQFNTIRVSAVYNDALLLLPKNVFGEKYYNIIGSTSGTSATTGYTYIAIQATSPGQTKFKITPNINTISGTNSNTNASISTLTKNTTYNYTLDQYDVFQLVANGGMTGTEVTADKPFVAIAGCPSCYNARKLKNDVYDHYSEQLFPYQSWGNEFAFGGFKKQGSERDQWRIIASEDTELTITPAISTADGTMGGTTKIQVKAREPKDIITSSPFHLKSTKPILVAGFLGDEGTAKDPSYMLVVPVQQFRSDYAFMIPANYSENNITIIAPQDLTYVKIYKIVSGSDSLYQTINASEFTKISSTNYMFYQYSMGKSSSADTPYKLIADKPVGVQSYGYTSSSSYAYPLGLNLTKLNNTN